WEPNEASDEGHELGDREDHVARRAALPGFAVDGKAHRQCLRICELVPRREIRTERRECIRALALEALTATIELEVALGEVDADAIAEHVIEHLAFRDVDARFADDDSQLDFPVDAFGLARHDEIVGRPAQRAGRLQEQSRLFRQRQPVFSGVVAVVQPDADDLADAAQRRAEYNPLLYFDERLCRHRGYGLYVVQRRRARIERLKAARQVEAFAIQKEAGLLAGCGAVTDELHALYNIRGSCKTASHYPCREDVAYEFSEAQRGHAAEGPARLLRHHKTQAAEAPEGGAHGGMDDHQCRGMGPDTDNGAHGAHAARRPLGDDAHP